MRKLLVAGVGGLAAAALTFTGAVPAALAVNEKDSPSGAIASQVAAEVLTRGSEQAPATGNDIEMPTSYPYQPTLNTYRDNPTGPNGEADYNTEYPGLMSHPQLAPALNKLMKKSDRVSVQVVGESTQGRDLYLVTVTEPETEAVTAKQEAWKDKIRNDPAAAASDSKLLSGYKTPIWISNNIHGNEWEGTDAAMQYIEYLATTDSKEVDSILRNNRIYFSPSLNPDGRTNATRATAQGFDPNRDMITLATPEGASFIESTDAIQPVYAADYHGYTSVLQFEPTGPPHGSNYEYDLYIPHNYALARYVEKDITAKRIPGNTYLTGPRGSVTSTPTDYIKIPYRDTPSGWDDFPPIFTAQYAAFFGGITATVELPKRRTNVDTGNGIRSLVTPEDAKINTEVAYESMTAVVDYLNQPKVAKELIENQIETFRRGVAGEPKTALTSENIGAVEGPDEWKSEWDVSDDQEPVVLPRAYVIPKGEGQRSESDANMLAQRLIDVGVKVGTLNADVTVGDTTYPKGSYIVDMHQPLRGLANVLLDLGEDISEKLPSMYDISAWSLGYLWGATVDKVGLVEDPAIGSYTEITETTSNVNDVDTGEYVTFDLAGVGDYQAVNEILDQDVPVTMIEDGSVVIADTHAKTAAKIAAEFDVALDEASASDVKALEDKTARGLKDLKIAYVGTQDDRVSLTELGFDDLTQITAASVTSDPSLLDGVDLIWVGGTFTFSSAQAAGRDAVQAWVNDGGSIAGRTAAAATAAQSFGLLQATAVAGNNSGNGIVGIDTPKGSVLEPYAQDAAFIYPAVSFTGLGSNTKVEQTYAEGNPLMAGHWRATNATNGPESAAGKASVISADNASGSRAIVFGTSVMFRNHPKGGLSQAARGIFWAGPEGEKVEAPKPKPSKVALTVSKATSAYGQAKSASIAVTSGGKAVTGDVKVTLSGKAVKTVKLASNGKAKVALSGKTKPGSYTVKAEYLGTDRAEKSSATAKLKVTKAKPKLSAKLAKSKIKASQRAKVSVKAALPGAKSVTATGKVQVKHGKKVLRTATMSSASKGSVTVTLPKLKKGSYTLSVEMPSTATQNKATAKKVKLKVS